MSRAGAQRGDVLVVMLMAVGEDGTATEVSRETSGERGIDADTLRFAGKKLRLVSFELPARGFPIGDVKPCRKKPCVVPPRAPPPPPFCP
jgi:hypothetical protein